MKAELYHKSSSKPIITLEVSTTEDEEGKIFEAEIKRCKLKLQPNTQLNRFLPVSGQERNPVSIKEFKVIINNGVFIPQEEIKIYFYRDRIEILDNVILQPEEMEDESED